MKKILLSFCLIMSLCAVSSEAAENDNIRLGVMKFLSRTDGVSEQQAAAIGDIFARILTNSRSLIIVERDRFDELAREHQLTQSGSFKDNEIIELGKLMSCNYMLIGSVTNLERKVSESDFWIVSETRQEITATIDVRVVDVTTSKVIMSFSESGSSARKGEGFNFYGIKTDKGKSFKGIEESAIAEAVFRTSFKIREKLAGERIQVANVSSKALTLNAGKNWGVSDGVLFGVYSEGREEFNLDGTSLGRKLTLLAIVKVTDAQNEFSYAQIVKNGGTASSIRKGNKLEPLTKKEADDLIKKKVFSGKKSGKKN